MSLLNTEANVCVNPNKECDLYNGRANIINTSEGVVNVIPSRQNLGEIRMPQSYDNINCERIDPGLLEAFKKNPYTQSLQSY